MLIRSCVLLAQLNTILLKQYKRCVYTVILPAELVQTVPEDNPLSCLNLKVANLTFKWFRIRDQFSVVCIDHLFVSLFSLLLPSLNTKAIVFMNHSVVIFMHIMRIRQSEPLFYAIFFLSMHSSALCIIMYGAIKPYARQTYVTDS